MPRMTKYDPTQDAATMAAAQSAAELEGIQRAAAQDKRGSAAFARDQRDDAGAQALEDEAQQHEALADVLEEQAEPYLYGRRGEDAAHGEGDRYEVLHDGISGGHRRGDIITASQLHKDTDFDFMVRVGALRRTGADPYRAPRVGENPTPTQRAVERGEQPPVKVEAQPAGDEQPPKARKSDKE